MKPVTVNFLPHALKRASQRGISLEMIKYAITCGDVFYRQGLRYFISLEKNLRGAIPYSQIEKFKNTVVIINAENQIITCYKNKRAVGHIRRKNKWLY